MSCLCHTFQTGRQEPGCRCDQREHPKPLDIRAGLKQLPRQVASFPDFRAAMLAELRSKSALEHWRARGEDDLGVMLLEMWAYVCDAVSLYDEVIAQEAYVRTALRKPSLRKLVGLLGYLPRPAVAALARLNARVEGRQPLTIPRGTAFRSNGFDGEAPQVFELDQAQYIHPLNNGWDLQPVISQTVGQDNPRTLYLQGAINFVEADPILLKDLSSDAQTQMVFVQNSKQIRAFNGQRLTKLTFTAPLKLSANTSLSSLRLLQARQRAPLWSIAASPASVLSNGLVLNAVYRGIGIGDEIVASLGSDHRWFRLRDFSEELRVASAPNRVNINGKEYDVTGNSPCTVLNFSSQINASAKKRIPSLANWTNGDRKAIVVQYQLEEIGRFVSPPKEFLSPSDPLRLPSTAELPGETWREGAIVLEDKNNRAVLLDASLKANPMRLEKGQGSGWSGQLQLPVKAWGNVLQVSRGKSVIDEILGSGNASRAGQRFKLRKKPLTHLPSPSPDNPTGLRSTLHIKVDGILWKETPSFFGVSPEEQVYILRQDDEGDSWVIFGDGIRGQRLPSGQDNVRADYRFGAGSAIPPAGAIVQVDQPVKDLQSVRNPLPAYGGADAEGPESMRRQAPRSVLILGRAVSVQDMEALAQTVPGVQVASASWTWNQQRQRAVIQVFFIGQIGMEQLVKQRLLAASDPTTPIDVRQAQAIPIQLSMDVQIDARYDEEEVLRVLRLHLTDAETGLLAAEQIGIGKPLFRSRILDAVLEVEGTLAVRALHWNGQPFCEFAKVSQEGQYFQFESGGRLSLNGKSMQV